MSRTARNGPGAQSPRSAFFGRVAALLAAIMIAVSAVPSPAEAAPKRQDIVRQGYLDRHPGGSGMGASGNLLIDHRARRGYQITRMLDHSQLFVYDLDTLGVVREVSLPIIEAADTVAGPTEWLLAFDSRRSRLFAIEKVPGAPFRDDYILITVDLAHFAVSRSSPLYSASERVPIALGYHEPSDRVYVMSRFFQAGPNGRSLFFVEERTPAGVQSWERFLPSCFAATDHQYAPTLVRSLLDPSKIYLNCYGPGAVQGLIVRLTLGSGGTPESDEVFPAVPGALSTGFDTGSDRMIFLTTISGAGRGAWVFDGRRSSFLGVIATGDDRPGAFAYSIGLDGTRGRLYMQTAAGILVADIRRTPLGAGLLFRTFAAPGVGRIEVDPVSRRFLVPEFRNEGQPERYVVYSDDIPTTTDAPTENPDTLTADIDERDGVTGVNYSGGAAAYGARTLLTGGLQKAAWNAVLGPFSTEDTGIDQVWRAMRSIPASEANRDVFAARIDGVALTNDSADASAVAIRADSGTVRDVSATGVDWPAKPATCDDSSSVAGATGGTEAGTGVNCDVEAASVWAATGIEGPGWGDEAVSASAVASAASIRREPLRGIVARSIATAHGVRIGTTVWIGSLTTTAEAWARGRRGSAGALIHRTLADVRVDSDGDGQPEYSCDACSLEEAQGRINAALGGQAAVEFPQPDAAFYPDGSPGGYQAIVQKERFREFAERALNDDDTLEVPGMQVIVYSDGRAGRTRAVVQLAGVQAEAHYGVYLLPRVAPPPPSLSPPPSVQPVPAPPPVLAPPPVATPAPRTIIERVARRIAEGYGVGIARPADAGLIASLLVFMSLPGYLLWRRRLKVRAS